MSNPIPIALTSVLPFKKHAGKKVEDVLRADPGYLFWLLAGDKVIMREDLEAQVRAWGESPHNRREAANILSKFKKTSLDDDAPSKTLRATVNADYNSRIAAEPDTSAAADWGCW
ncbi:hypothetical protein [Achromobacter sp. AGC39]